MFIFIQDNIPFSISAIPIFWTIGYLLCFLNISQLFFKCTYKLSGQGDKISELRSRRSIPIGFLQKINNFRKYLVLWKSQQYEVLWHFWGDFFLIWLTGLRIEGVSPSEPPSLEANFWIAQHCHSACIEEKPEIREILYLIYIVDAKAQDGLWWFTCMPVKKKFSHVCLFVRVSALCVRGSPTG